MQAEHPTSDTFSRPQNDIPDEVLLIIFELYCTVWDRNDYHVLEDYLIDMYAAPITVLSLVCRRWHVILVTSIHLWTKPPLVIFAEGPDASIENDVQLINTDAFQACQKRAGNALMEVNLRARWELDSERAWEKPDLREFITCRTDTWRSLSIEFSPENSLIRFVRNIGPLVQLKSLEIIFSTYPVGPFEEDLPFFECPQLESLTIQYQSVVRHYTTHRFPLSLPKKLTRLTLVNFPPTQLFKILRANAKCLVALDISFGLYPVDEADTDAKLTVFPKLLELRLTRPMEWFFNYVDVPKLNRFICPASWGFDLTILDEMLRSTYPVLRTLVLSTGPPSDHQSILRSIISDFSGVIHLSVHGQLNEDTWALLTRADVLPNLTRLELVMQGSDSLSFLSEVARLRCLDPPQGRRALECFAVQFQDGRSATSVLKHWNLWPKDESLLQELKLVAKRMQGLVADELTDERYPRTRWEALSPMCEILLDIIRDCMNKGNVDGFHLEASRIYQTLWYLAPYLFSDTVRSRICGLIEKYQMILRDHSDVPKWHLYCSSSGLEFPADLIVFHGYVRETFADNPGPFWQSMVGEEALSV